MHHSDEPSRLSSVVTCYCDDSGSHEEAAVAVVGGLLMNKTGFMAFDSKWNEILHEFRLERIHMNDFVRPNGKHVAMKYEMKIALFNSIVKAILDHRIYTFSVSVPQTDYRSLLSKQIYREVMGAYTMAFFVTIILNAVTAGFVGYKGRIGYLIDKGSDHHHEQMDAGHTVVLEWEKLRGIESQVGPLASDLDDNNNALQAADVIAWSYHRMKESSLTDEFVPLLDIFKVEGKRVMDPTTLSRWYREYSVSGIGHSPFPHMLFDVPSDGVKMFSQLINKWIALKGDMPSSLVDVMHSPAPMKGVLL